MYKLYPLLFYTGLTGALVVLGTAATPRLKRLQAALTAGWMTLLALLWLLLPRYLHWLFSLWAPLRLLDGALLIDLTPPLWALGAVVGLATAGVAWVGAAERRRPSAVGGALAILLLLVFWLTIGAGSLLLTLTTWAIFDLIIAAALLINGGDGERVAFTLMLNGFATILLWIAALIAGREGISTLWRTMWPIGSMTAIFFLAAVIRLGLYPFHIVALHRRPRGDLMLDFATMLQPLPGLMLLVRLLALPAAPTLPRWVMGLAAATLLWGGLYGLAAGAERWRYALYGLMGALVLGMGGRADVMLFLAAVALWVAAVALLLLHRGVERGRPASAWPSWLAALWLLGLPPSPAGALYRAAFAGLPWVGKVVLVPLVALPFAALLLKAGEKAPAPTRPPWPHRWLALEVGVAMAAGALLAVGRVAWASWSGWLFWLAAVGMAAALVRFAGQRLRLDGPAWLSLLDLFDLRWFYRALWRGWEHTLGVVRAAAEIVEGRGALIWSLLIVLVTLLMVMQR